MSLPYTSIDVAIVYPNALDRAVILARTSARVGEAIHKRTGEHRSVYSAGWTPMAEDVTIAIYRMHRRDANGCRDESFVSEAFAAKVVADQHQHWFTYDILTDTDVCRCGARKPNTLGVA